MSDQARAEATHEWLPPVSIIINTDGRAKSLAVTLESLRHLHYPNFEVIVVYGPTPDGTKELLESWAGRIKVGHVPRRNLSESRNVSVAMAAGDIVAFLDDDAIPEPEWLNQVAHAFIDPEVGGAGGYLFDHTGVTYQWKFGTSDRTGWADENWNRPAPELNFPYSATFPQFVGANSAFRLSALLSIGGFDENFIYYLDETDVICRLVDDGWKIVQIAGAPVHHKFLASHLRNDARVVTSWYQIIKSKLYFAIVNAQGHHKIDSAIDAARRFAGSLREGLEWHIANGRLDSSYRERFDDEYDRAIREGLRLGLSARRPLLDDARLSDLKQPFLPFRILQPGGERRCICLLTRSYPPGTIGGIGRYVQQLAQGLADLGHQVRVLTEDDRDTVDFEDGVWVHRRRRQSHRRPHRAEQMRIPQNVWDYSATMLEVAKGVEEERPIDAVFAPIWDCEGIAFLLDGRLPLATTLHTMLASYVDSHPHVQRDGIFMDSFVRPMLATEALMLQTSHAVVANSHAIVAKTEQEYGLHLGGSRLHLVPHGMSDWSLLPNVPPAPLGPEQIRVVFVGRLEERKGVDVLLAALERALPLNPNIVVDLVGNDRIKSGEGRSFREIFEAAHAQDPLGERVRFHGEVPDEQLRGFYAAADIFVAPSRFESFGLIFLEAMMFSKPVIGCKAGGVPEVVEDGRSGLLVQPGRQDELANAILKLAADPELRRRLGDAGRARYLERFTPEQMAKGMLNVVDSLARELPAKASGESRC